MRIRLCVFGRKKSFLYLANPYQLIKMKISGYAQGLPVSCQEWSLSLRIHPNIHQNILRSLTRVLINQGNKPSEMLAGAVCIECCPVRPLFNENKMPRILLIPVQIISNTQGPFCRGRDEFAVERENGVDALGLDKIFVDDI